MIYFLNYATHLLTVYNVMHVFVFDMIPNNIYQSLISW